MRMFGPYHLVPKLREFEQRVASHILPVIRVPLDTRGFDWDAVETCATCATPGIDVGQVKDYRLSTDADDGLHGQLFTADGGYVDFHLDQIDACRHPVGHVIADTHAVAGATIGVIGGALIGAAFGGAKGVAAGAAIGGLSGAAIGGHMPKRERKIVMIDELWQLGGR